VGDDGAEMAGEAVIMGRVLGPARITGSVAEVLHFVQDDRAVHETKRIALPERVSRQQRAA
jgi:hypothetical protein